MAKTATKVSYRQTYELAQLTIARNEGRIDGAIIMTVLFSIASIFAACMLSSTNDIHNHPPKIMEAIKKTCGDATLPSKELKRYCAAHNLTI